VYISPLVPYLQKRGVGYRWVLGVGPILALRYLMPSEASENDFIF